MNKIMHLGGGAMLATLLTSLVSAPAHGNEPLENPIPRSIPEGRVPIALEAVAEGLTAPNWGMAVPGCANLQNRLVVTDQDGILWAIQVTTGDKRVLLDVSDRLVSLGVAGPGTFDERGFLGVAFHPEFADNGLLYTYTSEPVDGPADFSTLPPGETANHQSVVLEWQIPEPCEPNSVVDPTTARELLRIDEPQFNHDAGALNFGMDGKLYISLGDGGAADDQGVGHVPGGNGQDPSNILGTLIRIDPDGANSANGQYGIPADNPFVGQPGFLDEIFAYGFRNPFRFSFDSRTGELWIADVGQNDIEEIDVGIAGGNYGWRLKEGSFCFDPNGNDSGFVFECQPEDVPADLIDPIAEYDHDEGTAVIGGFVYGGIELPSLRGRYVFGDLFDPASGSGRLFYLERNPRIFKFPSVFGDFSDSPSGSGRLFPLEKNRRIFEFPLANQENLGLSLLGFGQDAFGELYVLANMTGTPFGDTGVVLKIARDRGQIPARFSAHLSGDEEVPPVDTQAQGQALFTVNQAATKLTFKLIVANIEEVIAAHIHCAPQGVNGPIGVTLFSGGPVTVNGILAEGTLTTPDAGNACAWDDIADVEAAMGNGGAYVNVHTLAHPAGEIRGQIR
ncbi:CHRD domain-containing protein [Nitrosococcus wardiae]|uniref:CHRD domain-containing protein n=2 Tax=Nitrosococcus wardiae TaxID=1814290 RepID=A0A4P7C5Y7_9GAMM|nr:CHRD domain-containing protein [Nitrosococcus wardiae]